MTDNVISYKQIKRNAQKNKINDCTMLEVFKKKTKMEEQRSRNLCSSFGYLCQCAASLNFGTWSEAKILPDWSEGQQQQVVPTWPCQIGETLSETSRRRLFNKPWRYKHLLQVFPTQSSPLKVTDPLAFPQPNNLTCLTCSWEWCLVLLHKICCCIVEC